MLSGKIRVAARFPEVEAHDVRRVDEVVAALQATLRGASPRQSFDEAAFGVPEDEPGAGLFLDAEEVEFRAKLAVIAALGFLPRRCRCSSSSFCVKNAMA